MFVHAPHFLIGKLVRGVAFDQMMDHGIYDKQCFGMVRSRN